MMSNSARVEFLAENPHIIQRIDVIGHGMISPDPIRFSTRKHLPEGWRKKLNGLKNTYKGSTINDHGG